jgi:pyruvate dehydrogenase (quinone)
VLEVVTNREFPPLPPHIRLEMAQKMTKAIANGDEDSVGMMVKSAKGKLAEFKESLRP